MESDNKIRLNEPDETQPLAIVSSTETLELWGEVVDALLKKHEKRNPLMFTYDSSPLEVVEKLQVDLPYFVIFLQTGKDCNNDMFKETMAVVRRLTPGPYADCFWGILTAPDVKTALKIANQTEPLIVKRAISNSCLNFDKIQEGAVYSECHQHESSRKTKGILKPEKVACPGDLAEEFSYIMREGSDKPIDMFVTSAHASKHDWRIGYNFKGGAFIHDKKSHLLAKPEGGGSVPIKSPNPKVLLAVGNCYMGGVEDGGCMAHAWMKSANVFQMFGYNVVTWFGYAGWGIPKYFIDHAGQYTLNQAHFSNMQALYFEQAYCGKFDPKYIKGLYYDETAVPFYGDPTWVCKLATPGTDEGTTPNYHELEMTEIGDRKYKLVVRVTHEGKWTCPIPNDGGTRPGRPPVFVFPRRLHKPKVVQGEIVLTGLFALFPLTGKCHPGDVHEAIIEEAPIEESGEWPNPHASLGESWQKIACKGHKPEDLEVKFKSNIEEQELKNQKKKEEVEKHIEEEKKKKEAEKLAEEEKK